MVPDAVNIDLDLLCTDPEAQLLTFQLSLTDGGTVPSFLSQSGSTLTAPLTTNADAGNYDFSYSCDDSVSVPATGTFKFQVIQNLPPLVVGTMEEVIVIVFTPFDFVIPSEIFSDPEGLPLSLTLKSSAGEIPEFIEIVPADMRIRGFATTKDVSKYKLLAVMTDNNQQAVEVPIIINVIGKNILKICVGCFSTCKTCFNEGAN